MKLFIMIALVAMQVSAQTVQQLTEPPSHGTKAGGQTVDVNGTPSLRDLVNKSVCTWDYLSDFIGKVRYFPKVLESLDKARWYLKRQVEQEIGNLKVCITQGDLVQLPAEDRDKVTTFELKTKKQVAIRLNQDIYLDFAEFSKMSEIDQGYLILHEIIHSFLPMKTDRRNHKVESLIAYLRAYEINPTSKRSVDLQLTQNSVQTELDLEKSEFEKAFNEEIDITLRGEIAEKTLRLSHLTKKDRNDLLDIVAKSKTASNKAKAEEFEKRQQFMQPLKAAVLSGNIKAVNQFIQQNIDKITAQDIITTQIWMDRFELPAKNTVRFFDGSFYYRFATVTRSVNEDGWDPKYDLIFGSRFSA